MQLASLYIERYQETLRFSLAATAACKVQLHELAAVRAAAAAFPPPSSLLCSNDTPLTSNSTALDLCRHGASAHIIGLRCSATSLLGNDLVTWTTAGNLKSCYAAAPTAAPRGSDGALSSRSGGCPRPTRSAAPATISAMLRYDSSVTPAMWGVRYTLQGQRGGRRQEPRRRRGDDFVQAVPACSLCGIPLTTSGHAAAGRPASPTSSCTANRGRPGVSLGVLCQPVLGVHRLVLLQQGGRGAAHRKKVSRAQDEQGSTPDCSSTCQVRMRALMFHSGCACCCGPGKRCPARQKVFTLPPATATLQQARRLQPKPVPSRCPHTCTSSASPAILPLARPSRIAS